MWWSESRRIETLGRQTEAAELGKQGFVTRCYRVVLERRRQIAEEIQAIVTRCGQGRQGLRLGLIVAVVALRQRAQGELFLQGVQGREVFTVLDVQATPEPDLFSADIQAFQAFGQLALPTRWHEHVIPGGGAGGAAADVMFQFLPHVEHVDHVVTVGGVGNVQHIRLIQLHHRAQVQRVVVGGRHVLGRWRGQGFSPAQLVERGAVAGGGARARYRCVVADHPLHAYQRITPDVSVDPVGVSVCFKPGDDVFLAGGHAQQCIGLALGENRCAANATAEHGGCQGAA
ncbi:hypothetical protein D3C77_420010 [compost metagenome]